MEGFGKYLGVPSVLPKRKSKDFSYLLEKVWKLVQGWKGPLFSIAGKEILIKSVGQAILSYVMSVFRIPKGICDEITKSFARFWWGSKENKKKLHWCSWNKLCLPKSLGGLNFRDIEGFNQAHIVKQAWRILSYPDSLVASWFLKGIYFENSSFLEAGMGCDPSFLWKSLLWGRDLLTKGIRRIGHDKDILIFKDPWLPKELSFKPICINQSFINHKVSNFFFPLGDWDLRKLSEGVLSSDIEIIKCIPINNQLDNRFIWHFDRQINIRTRVVIRFF